MTILQILIAITFIILFLCLLANSSSQNTLLSWNWPLFKLIPTLYLKSHELYDKMTQILGQNKGTVLFKTSWFSNLDILVTSDPSNVQHVMNSKFWNYHRGADFSDSFDFLGDAIFIKDLDSWKEDKKFTHAFFKNSEFHKSIPKTNHHTLEKGLIPILDHASEKNQVLDFQDLFSRYMIDATFIMATGFDLASLRVGFPNSPLLNAMDDIAVGVFYRQILPERVWKLQRWLKIGNEKKMTEACYTFNQILNDYISKKHELTSENHENFDVLKFYLIEADNDIKHADKAFLAANIMTLLFAGRDTTASLLTWFFYLISRNHRVKNKILEEIGQNFPSGRHIFSNVNELTKLTYLQCALTETLRLFPAVPVILRDPIQEDVLPSGHKVSQTTKVVLFTYTMGRLKEIWGEDCREFKPERWLSDKRGIKHVASNNFLAFGSGPWACPGKELAFTRLKGVAATIMHNFHVDIVEGQIICPSASALLIMKHGLNARVTNRWI